MSKKIAASSAIQPQSTAARKFMQLLLPVEPLRLFLANADDVRGDEDHEAARLLHLAPPAEEDVQARDAVEERQRVLVDVLVDLPEAAEERRAGVGDRDRGV